MVDFTSALYLGLRHPAWALRPWTHLSRGKPAALQPPPGAARVAHQLAALQGCEAATLGPSTLHLFWDLFELLALQKNIAVFMDTETYPIARWGVERAKANGVPAWEFAHQSGASLRQKIHQHVHGDVRPVVVTDGFCPRCGQVAPLPDYLDLVRERRGWLVIDDTQALGILGERRELDMPYGRGGGGSSVHCGIRGPEVVRVSSLAKAFGAPVAVLSGEGRIIAEFVERSQTRVHCSPPSVPAMRSAERALAINGRHGERLRRRLLHRVRQFKEGLASVGIGSSRGFFPVQSVFLPGGNIRQAHRRLMAWGIQAVLQQPRGEAKPRLSFLITASHKPAQIDDAVEALAAVSRPGPIATEESYVCANYDRSC